MNIMLGENATLHDGLFLSGAYEPTKSLPTSLLGASNVWHPSPEGLVNYVTHLPSPGSQGFAFALEKAGSFRDNPLRFKPALSTFLGRLKAVGVTPDEGYADYLLLFNVSSEHNAAYLLVTWPRSEYFVVIVYAREIDQSVLASIESVDAALTRLARA